MSKFVEKVNKIKKVCYNVYRIGSDSMKDDRYVSIDIPPYIEPKVYYKRQKQAGYSSIIILSIVTLIIAIGIIVLGVYLGK